MKTTLALRHWHDEYENLSHPDKLAVDAAFKAAQSALKQYGNRVTGDDRAEELIAAITAYLIESKTP